MAGRTSRWENALGSFCILLISAIKDPHTYTFNSKMLILISQDRTIITPNSKIEEIAIFDNQHISIKIVKITSFHQKRLFF
ncbi:hypothetical protein QVD17_21243 [Tagetes erecta]|uniref:Uncharacterized protein n=1 Tax=Tagetes erecta TaxID=13708 RepID=A0AAD8NYW8_TARER|nr:hypothetical protein QVD17_21243 [Tagetes erecta]